MKIFLLIPLFVSITLLLQLGCKKDKSIINSSYLNIDPSVRMIARINNFPFYGEEYIDPVIPPIFVPATAIEAIDSLTGNKLSLSIYMINGNEPPFMGFSSLRYAGNNYSLISSNPYNLLVNNLEDSLISGNFFGTFLNIQLHDTVKIGNGYFNIKPEIPNDFFVSCSLKNNYFETQDGREYFERIRKKFETEDNQFEDSVTVRIKFTVGSLSEKYIKDYIIWQGSRQVSISIYIGEGSSLTNSVYTAYDGNLKIEEMITIVEQDTLTGQVKEVIKISKASFNFQAINDYGEIINITQGKYSYYGFNK